MIQELRLGNYVNLIAEGHENEPDLVKWDVEDYEFYENRMECIEPIPLSEELLLKIGIKQDKNDKDKFRIGGGYQVIRHDGKWLFRVIGCTLNEVPYLHKLQNIYYEIEGEELQINL